MRCLDKTEAESLLCDTFAEGELMDHLSKQYGPVKDLFHINYNPQEILNRFMRGGKNVSTDEIQEFEQALSKAANQQSGFSEEQKELSQRVEEASFDDLLKLCKEDLDTTAGDKDDPLEPKKKSKKGNVDLVVEDLRKKEKKLLGLDRQVSRSGFLVFEDRLSKLRMMQTPLFLFGMKLYR